MPRKGYIAKREVAPDPVYGSTLVTKFVNSMMWGGKKSTAQGIFYTAMTNLEQKGGDEALKLGEVEFLFRLKSIFFIGFTFGGEKQDVDKSRGVNADELDDLASADARKKH